VLIFPISYILVIRSMKIHISCERTYVCSGHIAFNANDIYIDDIYQYDWFMPPLWLQQAIRWKSQQRFNIVRFGEIYSISAFDLILHCIVIGMNSQWLLFILFAKRFLSRNIKIVELRIDICLCYVFRTILREWQFLCRFRQSKTYYSMNLW